MTQISTKKGRTLAVTVTDLFESPRLRIAVENFPTDPQLLKALFLELGMECTLVTKSKIIKEYSKHSKFNSFEMIPFLRSITDFTTYNMYWNLSSIEQKLYCVDPKFTLTKDQRLKLQDKVKKKFMGAN